GRKPWWVRSTNAGLFEVLGLPSHRAVDARAAARMIEKDDFLDRPWRELAVLPQFQRRVREAVRLARGIQTEHVRLALRLANDRGVDGRRNERIHAEQHRDQRQTGDVADRGDAQLAVTPPEP